MREKSGRRKNRQFSITENTVASGKMIEDENKEETKVNFQTYKAYLKYYGGWKVIVLS